MVVLCGQIMVGDWGDHFFMSGTFVVQTGHIEVYVYFNDRGRVLDILNLNVSGIWGNSLTQPSFNGDQPTN